MENTLFTAKEYKQMIHFAAQIVRPVPDVRSSIQHELAKLFGYDETIFWYADDHGNLRDPVTFGLSDRVLYDYLEGYQEYDFLHPKKNAHLFREKKTLRLNDLVTSDQYENSSFYRSFMKPHGYYDEMVTAVFYEGVFVAVIGMAQKKNRGIYTSKDCERFHYLSEIIGSVLVHQTKNETVSSLLSKREEDVVQLIKEGWTNQAIAQELYISINTVKKHLQNIYQKYGVQNRTQLVRKL